MIYKNIKTGAEFEYNGCLGGEDWIPVVKADPNPVESKTEAPKPARKRSTKK